MPQEVFRETCSICSRKFPRTKMRDLGGYEGEPPAWNSYPVCKKCYRKETAAPEPQIEDSGDNQELPF